MNWPGVVWDRAAAVAHRSGDGDGGGGAASTNPTWKNCSSRWTTWMKRACAAFAGSRLSGTRTGHSSCTACSTRTPAAGTTPNAGT